MKLPSWRVLGLAAVVTSSIAACGSDDQKYLESGKAFLEKKEDASALIQFKNAISQNPENAAARFLFARTLRRMGDLPAAETEFRKALSLGHERGPVVLELAPTLLDMGQAGKALDELGNVPSPDPAGRAELAALRGDALLMQGDVAGARLAYDEALSLSAGHPRALVGQARIEMAGGNRAAGLAALDRVEKEHPDFAPAWNIRAAVALQDGKIDDAVKAYDRAIALQPADARAYVGIVPALLSLKRIDDASGRVAMLVKVAPGTPATKYLQALIDYTKGDRIGARGAAVSGSTRRAPGRESATVPRIHWRVV